MGKRQIRGGWEEDSVGEREWGIGRDVEGEWDKKKESGGEGGSESGGGRE